MTKSGFLKRLSAVCLSAVLIVLLTMVLGAAAEEAYADTVTVSRYTGKTYTHNSAFANAIIVDGVDVSYVQKKNVDWKKAKADGVDYAIIRVGARGYGQAGKLIVDDYYKENIRAAQDAGLMVGVYFFSQAVDPLEAYAEAQYTLELIEGFDLDLPVYMDYEFASDSSNPGRLNTAQLSKIKMTENAEMFLETIEAGGYEAGFYANRNFLNNTVNGKSIGERWPVWLASYDTYTDYAGNYNMWQYSSNGYIEGYSGRVDVNFMYLEPNPVSEGIYSLTDCRVNFRGTSSFAYSYGTVHEPQVSVSSYGFTLTEGVDYEVFYLKNANAGTGYVLVRGIGNYSGYQLVPFTIRPSAAVNGITVAPVADQYYSGTDTAPASITVKDAYGSTLVQGLDYTYTVTGSDKVGTATITVTLMGNYSGTKTATYKILPGKQTLTAEKTVYDVTMEDGSFQLEGIKTQSAAVLTFTSDNEAVAAVDAAGTVTVTGPGTANITVKAEASYGYEEALLVITVNVSKPQQKLTASNTSYTKARLSQCFFLGAVAESGSDVTYVSMDTSVAKVSSSGRVTLMGPGTTEIVVTAPETEVFAGAELRIPVTVKEMDEEEYQKKYDKLKKGIENTKVVSVKAYPEKKKVKLTWKKSNSGYAVEYYQIWRSTKKSSGYSKIYTTSTASKKYYVNSKGLKPGTTYWYKVRGVRSLEGKLVYTPFTKIQVTTKK